MTDKHEHHDDARAAFDKASTAHAMAERALAECTKIWQALGKPAEPTACNAFPPSGKYLSMFGVVLNSQPPDVLLQVIEAMMAREHRLGHQEDDLTGALYYRLRGIS